MRYLVFGALCLLLSLPAAAKQKNEGHKGKNHNSHATTIRFSNDQKVVIKNYYTSLPPGLAKKGKIPPGWRKKMIVGKPLPPDIVIEIIPVELERKLPPLPPNYVRFSIGTSMFIKDKNTNVLVDAHWQSAF